MEYVKNEFSVLRKFHYKIIISVNEKSNDTLIKFCDIKILANSSLNDFKTEKKTFNIICAKTYINRTIETLKDLINLEYVSHSLGSNISQITDQDLIESGFKPLQP